MTVKSRSTAGEVRAEAGFNKVLWNYSNADLPYISHICPTLIKFGDSLPPKHKPSYLPISTKVTTDRVVLGEVERIVVFPRIFACIRLEHDSIALVCSLRRRGMEFKKMSDVRILDLITIRYVVECEIVLLEHFSAITLTRRD